MILARKSLRTWLSHLNAQVKGASIIHQEEEGTEADLEDVVADLTQREVGALCSSLRPQILILVLFVRSVVNRDIQPSDAIFASTTTTSLKNLLKPWQPCASQTSQMREAQTGTLTPRQLLMSPTLCKTKGRKVNGLYQLENLQQIKALYSSRQRSASDVVWHRRLGHPHQQILQHLFSLHLL